MKAEDNKVVAEEERVEETVNVEIDDDFLGAFEDDDDQPSDKPQESNPKKNEEETKI